MSSGTDCTDGAGNAVPMRQTAEGLVPTKYQRTKTKSLATCQPVVCGSLEQIVPALPAVVSFWFYCHYHYCYYYYY